MTKVCPCRDTIARLAENGMKNTAISSKLGVPLRTVQKIVKQWREKEHVQPRAGSGRKRTVNTRRMRGIIKKRIDRKDDLSLNQMAKQLNISRKTVQMIVNNELGLRSYRLLNGQVFTDQAKENRKEKCKKLWEFFKVRRIEDVLWSDEKVFTVEVAKNPQNHRQLLRPALKNNRKRKKPFPGKLNGGDSREGFGAWKQKHPNFIFQQDWAPAHGAKTTINFLETKIGCFLTKDFWPSNSPDLNPLDFSVWGFMEDQLRSKNVKNLEDLRRELIEIWNNIDVNYLRHTSDSMKRRIDACIKADGGHFENTM
ncbi:hypothetical protein Y032_0685g1523 [Ancylostoma ceylanicum]|uniref:Tc1-like transposase DDE domain-containing protein n=1 Tax=Ancylostoma ceylanicum TaxID=53326 RepID=A0A016WH60_9BILA|nr:hypothetical protein Y032_0685g1523 [Ancylostoma ceylanicum]